MRINPIRETNYPNYNSFQTKKLTHKSPNSARITDLSILNQNYNQVRINFRGVPNTSLELIKQIPLEDRLASLFQNFRLGDLILVGKNLQDCAKKMYKNANLVQNAIKRSFYIADDKIGGSLGFIKNSSGDTEVINLNDFEIPLISGNKTYPLKPQESFYVIPEDVLSVDGNLLKIKDEPKTNLSMYRKNFARAFDYEKEVKQNLETLNKKTLSKLMKTDHKGTSAVTFAEVRGYQELKDTLKKDIIYPLHYPDAYENMELNRGFILYGPPGTGKTHIARALANEAGANFISLNGLDLESKWVGESEANWRSLFTEAKENQPTIIFLDEFDAVARSRDSKDEYGNKVVNQILTLMTDIDNEGDSVFVIGATNNYAALDKAIIRSGRFGKHYEVKEPDMDALREIFKVHTKKKTLDENINTEELLSKLHSLKATGADIKHIVNDAHNNGYVRAGIFTKMENKTFNSNDLKDFKIEKEDFDKAIDDFMKDRKSNTRKPIGYNKQ